MLDGWGKVLLKKAIRTTAEAGDPQLVCKKAGDAVVTEDGTKYSIEINFVGGGRMFAVHETRDEVVMVDTSGSCQRGIERWVDPYNM